MIESFVILVYKIVLLNYSLSLAIFVLRSKFKECICMKFI